MLRVELNGRKRLRLVIDYRRLNHFTLAGLRTPALFFDRCTGAVHLSKNTAGVLRPAQRGQKPRVEQKGKSWLDLDVQYA